MATIAFQMTSTPLTGSKSFTGTDQDMTDLLAWAAVAYDSVIQQTFNAAKEPGFVPTNAQIGAALAIGTMNAWKDAVKTRTDAAKSGARRPRHNHV